MIQTPTEEPVFFGQAPDARSVHLYTIRNANLQMTVTDYGAAITSLKVTTPNGLTTDVVLGFDHADAYINSINLPSPPYLGAIIGRWAGRIANGIFKIDGKSYQLQKNNGEHALHGGRTGLSQKLWQLKKINSQAMTLSCFSPDGDAYFPGALTVEVTYSLTDQNELKVEYRATATQDTILNLTQHSYFNLDGHGADVRNQDLQINAAQFLETENMIPTGRLLPVEASDKDFRSPKKCPDTIDTTFVLENTAAPAAVLQSRKSKIKMTVFTNQPAVHVYVGGNCFGRIKGKENVDYHAASGICFETQNFPDAPNHANFPDALLRKGETYQQTTIFKFEFK